MPNHPVFTARIIAGSGKGKAQGYPTLNLNLKDIPADVSEGIYAARVTIGGERFDAAVHHGERPVHGLGRSFEAHLLKVSGMRSPAFAKATAGKQVSGMVNVEIVKRLREVRNFESEEELKKQINDDIEQVKSILGAIGA